ncbi:MAG: carboxypeptidase-like regulatory domain-containing protein, partial [Acidobacteriota bacterium]|nr:carboxypeptidase-like regulatory domain-containing protein [Acidobacteriota bacterium]
VQSDVPLAPIVVAAQTRPIVVFRLVDPDGRPVTETPEILIKYSSNFSSTPQIAIRETEGAGHFEVKGIYPSRPSILIRPAQWIDLVIEDLELEAGQRLDLGERVLEPGAQLAGRVVDPDDVPVPDATVEVSFMTEYGSSSRSAQADRSGRYRVFGLPEDPAYSASATADGFRPDVQQQVAPNAEDVDFVLEPNSIVKGRVLDESGRPITMFQIGLYSEASENDSTFSAMANTNKPETIVDDEGRFVHETAPGHYTVQIDTEQTAPARRGDVELSPGETVDIGDVTLVAGLTITGRVLGPTGRGIAEAEVGTKSGDLMAQFTGATTAVADTATTDENGRFELRGFIPGSVTLSAQHAEYSAATETLELIADEEPAEVILTLEAGGDVVGVLVDDNGAPRVGAMIMLHRGLSAVMTRLSARTGAEGRYRLEQVPAGSYEAMCFLSLDNPQSRVSARISVENNQTTTFNCDPPEGGIDVSGRLLQAGSTLPNRGMILVPVDSLSGTPSMSDFTQTSSNESGHYEARVQRPGPYTVVVDGGTGSITTQIDVPAGVEKATVDVVIESGRITGTVRAADGAELERVSIQSFLLDGTGAAPGLLPGAAAQTGAGKDGRFEVAGLPMGDYRVVAIAPRYQAAELSPVSVGDGAIPDIELVLELSDVVRLRVTDPEGNPVAG